MGVTAFIPAKMTSRRLPEKNMALLGGQPLLYYSIEVAKKVQQVDSIVVSSESAMICDYARACGVFTDDRNDNLSDHHVSALDVIKDWYERCKKKPDQVLLLQPTHPFRRPADIDDAIEQFKREEPDCLLSVAKEDVLLGEMDGSAFLPEHPMPRDKSKEPARYRNTGSFYLFDPQKTFLSEKKFGENISGYLLKAPEFEVDIDLPSDLRLAEALLAANKNYFNFDKAT